MGAEQSSNRGPQHGGEPATKTCYYEVLGIDREATEEEIKKAYRKKALELHPDRNFGNVEAATIRFAEVSSAYEVLSDPQERAWYDSHRDSILKGDSGGTEEHFDHDVRQTSADDIIRLMARFTSKVPFTDEPTGFYGILRALFDKLADEEYAACSWAGLEAPEYVDFGGASDNYGDTVKGFYRMWVNFSTQKTFAWREKYRASDAPDRGTRRLMEKENKKLREEGIREFNDAVRSLVLFVRKRDPRFTPNTQTDAERATTLREAAAAQAARSRAANQAKFSNHTVPEWARSRMPEEESDSGEEEVEEVEHIECVVCGKIFKSEKQYEAHEKSKKHLKAVREVQKEMRKQNKKLDLSTPEDIRSSSSPDLSSTTPRESRDSALHEASQDEEDGDDESATDRDDASHQSSSKEADNEVVDATTKTETSTFKPTRRALNHSPSSSTSSLSTPSSTNDEYASRDAVESRLATSLKPAASISSSPDHNILTSDLPLPSKPVANTTATKSKSRRAKPAAKNEDGAQKGAASFKCIACNAAFASRNEVFVHVKATKHWQPVPSDNGYREKGEKAKSKVGKGKK